MRYYSTKMYIFVLSLVVLCGSTVFSQTTMITWEGAGTGTETVLTGTSTSDVVNGCSQSFNYSVTVSDPLNVFDVTRSESNGEDGAGYYTFYMDNVDGGCNPSIPGDCNSTSNPPYNAGDYMVLTYEFDFPVIINELIVGDIDASDASNPPSGSSSFQDVVTFSAVDESNSDVTLSVSEVQSSFYLAVSGQTATATWRPGANYNAVGYDPTAQVRVSSSAPVKSFTITYYAGPAETNPAQQKIYFGSMEVQCPTILPVELVNFDADVMHENDIMLKWTTASEINNDYFSIEMSRDAEDFQGVARIGGHGNTHEIINYSHLLKNVQSGTYYFRLKQVDFDGQFAYSDIRVVEIARYGSEMTAYPNPSKGDFLSISGVDQLDMDKIQVIDIMGRNHPVAIEFQQNELRMSTSNLSNGTYYLISPKGRLPIIIAK